MKNDVLEILNDVLDGNKNLRKNAWNLVENAKSKTPLSQYSELCREISELVLNSFCKEERIRNCIAWFELEMNEKVEEFHMIKYQRLRNLTTGLMHTCAKDVREDLEMIVGCKIECNGPMITLTLKALEPWLKKKIKEGLFWNGELNRTHEGNYRLPKMSDEEKRKFSELCGDFLVRK